MDNQKEQSQTAEEPTVQTKQTSQSPFSKYLPLVVIAIVFVILASAGTYLASKQSNTKPQNIIPPSPTPIPNPTANWKTYVNSQYGYSIKYPPSYFLPKSGVTLESEYSQIIIAESGIAPASLKQVKKTTIANVEALELPVGKNMDGGIEFETLIPTRNVGSGYLRIFFSTRKPGYENQLEEFRKILSTFKFLP